VELIKNLVGEITKLTVSADSGTNYASFESDGLVITTILILGTYPKYDALIPKSTAYHLIVDSAQLARAIEASGEPVHIVRLQAAGGVLTIRYHDDDDNAVEIRMPSQGQIKVAVNQRYLLDLLECMSGKIDIRTNEPMNPIVVQSDLLTYVLMPMWVQWEK
jgi:DNA polymerase III sliding clamp (beta) subunit (PCNA family)